MYIGLNHIGQTFYDCLGNSSDEVVIDDTGSGKFTVQGGSISVWVEKGTL